MRKAYDIKGVHPATLKRMRAYAVKQAISELNDRPTPKEMEFTAKRHLISYAELKEAYYAEHPRE